LTTPQDIQIKSLKNFSDINFEDLFPATIVILPEYQDEENIDLKELFQELNDECYDQIGYRFRITQSTENHVYSKCRYSDRLQTRNVKERKRNNFGKEKFDCVGILNIHRNYNYFSILFQHNLSHQPYVDTSINGEIMTEIQQKARLLTPSQIYKQLLSSYHDKDLIQNITISQVR
jgi:hypothetical protein